LPAFSAGSSLWRGRIGRFSSRRTPGAKAKGNVTTTVCGSDAETVSVFPPAFSESARMLPVF